MPSSRSAQSRSARSRSEGACENCTEQAIPSSAKRGRSSGVRHCACSIRWRRPLRLPGVARRLERVERVPVRLVADRVDADRPAALGAAPDDLLELLAAGDLDAGAVGQQRGLRAERAVHEALQVADPQVLVAEAGAERERARGVELLVRDRAPDAQREVPLVAEALEDPGRAEPAVLVVDRADAARVGELEPGPRRLDPLVLGREHVAVAEAPGRLLAQDPGRLARLVALDDAAVHVEVAAGGGERGRVEPGGVVVLRDQDRRRLAGDLVERLLRRLDSRLPVAVPPAVAAQPAPGRDLGLAHARERLVDRRAAVQLHLALRERPGREVDVRVGEGGEDAAAAEVDDVRAGERGLVDADAARDVRAGDRERPSGRQRRIERADDPVLENHGAEPSPNRTLPLSLHRLNHGGECSPRDPQESRDLRSPLGLGADLGRRRRSRDRSRADCDHRPGQLRSARPRRR